MKRPGRMRLKPLIPGKDLAGDLDKAMMRLGEIANDWAGIEFRLCVAFMLLSQTNYETATVIFYTPSSFRGRLQMILNLASHVMPACKERGLFVAALNKLNKLNSARNAFVHASYGMTTDLSGEEPDGWISRQNIQPNSATLRSSVKAQLNAMDHHLEMLNALHNFLFFFCAWSNPYPKCPVRHWAKMASIKPGTMSS